MKKITLVSAIAAAAFAATAAFSATSVFAAGEPAGTTTDTTTDTTPTKTKANTTAKINLTVENSKVGLNGITLDQAPAIDFSDQTLVATGYTYKSKSITGALQVTNPGVDQGWTVQVSSSAFASDKNTLKGAVLTLNAGTVSNGQDNQSKAATPNAVTLNGSGAENANALTAADGTVGVGVTTESFAATDASLKVPAGNVAGDYSANLNWTLTDSVQ
ncbi:WxL domain-containing protein [Lacticaseibacillus sp. N501-2]|uniref:WxL domain-containing protein n=1 Tax=Lacticaseibacillus salsurae TaxID=3367729 RepID=UPI0038B3817B